MSLIPNENNTALLFNDNVGKPKYISPYMRINKVIKKIPEKCEAEEIEIFYRDDKNEKTFRVPFDAMYDEKLFYASCIENYCIYQSYNAKMLLSYLTNQLRAAIHGEAFKYENKSIGWYNFEGKQVFLLDEKTLPSGAPCTCIKDMGKWKDGSEEEYDKMLNNYVFNNEPMSLAYIMGFAGVLVSRISPLRDLGVVLSGFSGQSTSGKTTAINLIASIWANPNNVSGRIIMRADASNIGFNAQFAGFNGVPIIFDDVDQNSQLNISDQLNRLSQGTQRVVADVNGDPKYNRMGFSGICIFASECPLLDKTRKETGLYPRFIDLQDIVWTKDAKSAEKIKAICSQNYGFKGKKFAEFMETKSAQELCQIFDEGYAYIDKKIVRRDKFTPRAIKKYAAVIATANLLMDCFGMNFDLEKIANYLIINENKNIEERDKPTLAYDYIKDFFIENNSRFSLIAEEKSRNEQSSKFYPAVGIAAFRGKKLHLYIKTSTVDEILTKAGYNQLANYKKVWKEKGWTQCPKDRYDASSNCIIPARHFHFIYPDYDGVVQKYINTFKPVNYEFQPITQDNTNIVDILAPIEEESFIGDNQNPGQVVCESLAEKDEREEIKTPVDNFVCDDSEYIDKIFEEGTNSEE